MYIHLLRFQFLQECNSNLSVEQCQCSSVCPVVADCVSPTLRVHVRHDDATIRVHFHLNDNTVQRVCHLAHYSLLTYDCAGRRSHRGPHFSRVKYMRGTVSPAPGQFPSPWSQSGTCPALKRSKPRSGCHPVQRTPGAQAHASPWHSEP